MELSPFWKRNIDLYRFLGLPFITIPSTNAYIDAIEIKFCNDHQRCLVVKNRLIKGRRMRIGFLKFSLSIFLTVTCACYIQNDTKNWLIYLVTFYVIALALYISYFNSIKGDFDNTSEVLSRRTVKIEHEKILTFSITSLKDKHEQDLIQSKLSDSLIYNKEISDLKEMFRNKLANCEIASENRLLYSINNLIKNNQHKLFLQDSIFDQTVNSLKDEHAQNLKNYQIAAHQKFEKDTQILREELEELAIKKAKNARSKEAIIFKIKDRLFEFVAKQLLIIEYFKYVTINYQPGEAKINFNATVYPEIVIIIMKKYSLGSKGETLLVNLRKLSFLNFHIGKNDHKQTDNFNKIKEVQEYLILAGYEKAEKALRVHIEKEKLL